LKGKRVLRGVVKATSQALNRLGLDYVLVGGVAVSGWGVVRTTEDVDVIVDLKEKDADRFAHEFAESGFRVTVTDISAALRERSHFTIFDNHSTYRIDAKGAYEESARETLASKRPILVEGVKTYLASPEDTIANKLLYGSEQDLRDAEGILARQSGKLDLDRLRNLCRKLGVLGELSNLEKRVKTILSNKKDLHIKRFRDH
jgi:hypothetical protein